MWKYAFGGFLILHGLMHLAYLSPSPNFKYSLDLSKSRLLNSIGFNSTLVRPFGRLLVIVSTIGFVTTGFAIAGGLIPQEWGLVITLLATISSLTLLICFWQSWITVGIGIDLWLLFTLLYVDWQPFDSIR